MSPIEDREQIRDVLSRFCIYLDGGTVERMRELFTLDCDWDGGPLGHTHDLDALVVRMGQIAQKAPPVLHCVTNDIIRIAGDEARAHSYVTVLGNKPEPAAVLFAGYYLDRLAKQSGRWLIRERRIRRDLYEFNRFFDEPAS